MSCNDDIQYWRVIQKYSTIPGQAPTIPPSQDHNDGTWSDTDLYVGELFMNVIDNRIWYRSGDGIHEIGATTSGTGSFVGDYVPTAGGTFSGPVYSPTFSAEGIIATLITASAFAGPQIGTSASYIYGDGSNLTGITVAWNGGTVSNPAQFINDVYLDNFVHINGTVKSDTNEILFDTGIEVAYGVSASYFIGDGSGLTNLPTGTYSDTYTTAVGLSGSTLIFDRNDMPAAYYVNLAPILSTYSISTLYWNELTSELTLQTEGGDTFTQTINTFDSINVYSDITANNFYGGTFNGTFNGTFSGTIDGDIYTQTATLVGTTIEFGRTNGTSYSVDLSGLSGAGGTQSLAQTLAQGNETGNHDILLTNSGVGGSFGIMTNGNALTDARFLFEDYGTGKWVPAMRVDTATRSNYVTVGENETYLHNSYTDLTTNTYGQVYVDPLFTQAKAYDAIAGHEASTTVYSYQAQTDVSNGTEYTNTTQGIQSIGLIVDSGSVGTGSTTFDMSQYQIQSKVEVVNDGGSTALVTYLQSVQSSGVATTEMTTANTSQGQVASIYNTFDPGNSRVENIFQVNTPNPYGSPYVTTITQRKDEIIVEGSGGFRGIEYAADYSNDFTANSLVTKDWVLSNMATSLTDTVCNRTDEIFVDASGGEYECNPYIYPTTSYTTIRSAMSGATAGIYVDPDTIRLNVVEIPGSYESEVTITDEVLTMYGGRSDANNQTTWGIELGTEVRRYRYEHPSAPWGDVDKFEEKRFVLHEKFTNDSGTPGQIDLYYENFVQDAINDFEIDFYIMNSEVQASNKKYMTKSYKRRVYYNNYNQATILIPDETKQGDTLDPAYNSWSITTQTGIYGTKYVLDYTLDGSYDYSVTIVVRQTAKKY